MNPKSLPNKNKAHLFDVFDIKCNKNSKKRGKVVIWQTARIVLLTENTILRLINYFIWRNGKIKMCSNR